MGSRGIYHDGWFADAIGPRLPWLPGLPKGFFDDKASLRGRPITTNGSFTISTRTGRRPTISPPKCLTSLAQMKELFIMEFAKNNGFPVGGGLFVPRGAS